MTPSSQKSVYGANALKNKLEDDENIISFDDEGKSPVTTRVFQGDKPALRNWRITADPTAPAANIEADIFEEEKKGRVSTRETGLQVATQYLAIFMTVSWFTYAGLYIFSQPGGFSEIFSSPLALGSVIATVLTPAALLWICMSAWQRRTDAHLYAESLRHELQRLLFPTKEQAQAVNSDLQLLMQQAADVSATSRAAIKAIQKARQGLRAEIRDFAGVSQKTEFHIDRLAETLHKRSEHLLSLTDKIEARGQKITADADKGLAQWLSVADKAYNQFEDFEAKFAVAGDRFENQAAKLKNSSSQIAAETIAFEEILESRIEKLSAVSKQGIQTVEATTENFSALTKNAEALFTKANQAEETISRQIGIIRQSSEQLAERISVLDEVGKSASNKLGESLALALSGSDSIVSAVRRAKEQLEKAASEAAGKTTEIITATDEKLQGFAVSTVEQTEKVKSMLADFGQTEHAIAEMIEKLSAQNKVIGQATDNTFDRLTEAAELLDNSAKAIEERTVRPVELLREANGQIDAQLSRFESSVNARVGEIEAVTGKAQSTSENISSNLRTHLQDITDLSSKVSDQAGQIKGEFEGQKFNVSEFISDAHSKIEAMQNRLREQNDSFAAAVLQIQDQINNLDTQLASRNTSALSQIEDQNSKLVSLTEQAGQTDERLGRLINTINETASRSADIFDGNTNRAQAFSDSFERLHDRYKNSSDEILEKIQSVDTGLNQRFGNLNERAETASRNLRDLTEVAQNASEKLEQAHAGIGARTSELQSLTDQAKERTDNMRDILDGYAAKISETASIAVTQIEDATALFGKSTESVEESAMTGTIAIESAIQKILDEGQRASAMGEQALHKAVRVVATVQEESNQLADKSRDILAEIQRVSDSLQMKSREVEEYSKAALNSTRNYSEELKAQVEQISQSSAKTSDEISEALSELSKAAEQADENGVKIIQRLKFARETLGIEADNFEAATQKSSIAAEEIASKFQRQGEAVAKSVQDIASHAERLRDIQLRTSRENFLSSAKFVVEGLHSLAVDVARHLENDIDEKSWRSFQKGDVAAFTRRLIDIADEIPHEQAKRKFVEDGEFRNYAQRYIRQFEELLETAQKNDHGELLAAIFSSSDIGNLYSILCGISGRTNQIS